MVDYEMDTVIQRSNKYTMNNDRGEFFAEGDQVLKTTNKPQKIQFKSFYPYSGNLTFDGISKIDLSNQNQQTIDIFYGKSDILEIDKLEGEPVNLNFHRALAKIKFDITIGVGLSPANLKELKAQIQGMNTLGELDFNGNISNKRQIAPISLSIGDRGATAEVAIFPEESSADRSITFTIAGKELVWHIPPGKIFDKAKTYQMAVKLTDTKCYVWSTNENLEIIYSVGDNYPSPENPQGIVFWVDPTSNGKHGKAFHTNFGRTIWSHKKGLFNQTVHFFHGATDVKNGHVNTAKILTRHQEEAALYCTKIDGNWYLPAITELERLFSQPEIADCLPNQQDIWSSTEVSKEIALSYNTLSKNQNPLSKGGKNTVIPVSRF